MRNLIRFSPKSFRFLFFPILIPFFLLAFESYASSPSERRRFQRSIIDYRHRLNPKYKKIKRKQTRYIIVHTSELGFKDTLKVVSKGKRLRRNRYTYGGHIHYVINRDGRTYRILSRVYIADHAGKSMWNGERNISRSSIGIELVGYHYDSITRHQYQSLKVLIDILQNIYRLTDRSVLTHSQVAYGGRNQWFRKRHRGRKRCAKNFIHERAGVKRIWAYDPDVKAGRLLPDPQLAKVFYGKKRKSIHADESNIISAYNSAWSIAGEDYDHSSTLYRFPDGRVFRGDEIRQKVGWRKIPKRTIVLLNQKPHKKNALKRLKPVVKLISSRSSAYSSAGDAYNDRSTIYIFPSGRIKLGSSIKDQEELPAKTRLMMGYRGPFKLTRGEIPFEIASHRYKDRETIYYLPSKKLLSGDKIKDFTRIPVGTIMFLPFL